MALKKITGAGIVSGIILSLALSSCSDEADFNPALYGDDYYSVNIEVKSPEIIKTRGRNDIEAERKVNSVTLLFYHNGRILQKTELTSGTDFTFSEDATTSQFSASVNVPLSSEARQSSSALRVLAVANSGTLLNNVDEGADIDDVKEIVKSISDGKVEDNSGYLMSFDALRSASDASLQRLCAKITMEDSNSDDLFSLTGFQLCNVASGVSLGYDLYGNDSNRFLASTTSLSANESEGSGMFVAYSYPSKGSNAENDNGEAFVIVEGLYDGLPSYYKICLKSNGTCLDIERNYWYQIEITEATGAGYSSASEAVAGLPGDGLGYVIHDHSPKILNMVSDGVKELGVTSYISGTNQDTKPATFTVRLAGYDYTDEMYPAITANNNINSDTHKVGDDYKVTISEGNSWMQLISVSIDSSSTPTPTPTDQDGEGELAGKSWVYTVTFDPSKAIGGEMRGLITVEWAGLKREIPVTYKANFNPTKVAAYVNLRMYDTDNSKTIDCLDYYWNFLAGQAVTVGGKRSQQLYGIQEADMGPDKIRNEGFHFPVMYGDDPNDPWWYEYQILLFDNSTLKSYSYYTVRVRQNGRFINTTSGTWGTDNLHFTTSGSMDWDAPETKIERGVKTRNTSYENIVLIMRRCKGALNGTKFQAISGIPYDYDYSTAELVVTLYSQPDDDSEEGVEYSFNLYHTGFFHPYLQEDISFNYMAYVTDTPPLGYYYYEVVPLNGQYWLDRNLGATASGMYRESASGSDGSGWPFTYGAVGGFYRPASYNSSAYDLASHHLYEQEICPPGYRFPRMQEWDNIRLSSNFKTHNITENGVNYYSAYYNSENVSAGRINFPKARYYNLISSSSRTWIKSGDDYSGYYWTATDPTGTEKEKLGRYLKALYINGASTSYVFGDVSENAMNLRCVANATPSFSLDTYTISFNVKGATNVFLYTVENGTKKPLVNWPGKAVGDYETMQNATINFSYLSGVDYDQLYVVFTYVNKSGRILTIGSTGDINTPIKDVKGWKVEQGATYSFQVSTSGGEVTDITSKRATKSGGGTVPTEM